jgi:hypothetical protein
VIINSNHQIANQQHDRMQFAFSGSFVRVKSHTDLRIIATQTYLVIVVLTKKTLFGI